MKLPDDEKDRIENSSKAYHGSFNDENIRNITWVTNRIVQESSPNNSVLELGLGDGSTTQLLSNYFNEVTTIDGSSKLIKSFREKVELKNLTLIDSFFEDFESDQKFDNIIMSNILEHVYDPKYILEKYLNFIKKDGVFYLCVPSATSLNRRIGKKAGLLKDIYEFQEQDHLLGHRRYFDLESFKELILEAGLEIDWIEGVALKPITTSQMKSLSFDENIFNALLEIGVKYPELSTMILIKAKAS